MLLKAAQREGWDGLHSSNIRLTCPACPIPSPCSSAGSNSRGAWVQVHPVTPARAVATNNIVSRGLGKDDPIESNATAAGRAKNRRVELVVSGAGITDAAGSAN